MPHSHTIDMKPCKKTANNHDGFSVLDICLLETGLRDWLNCKEAIQKLSADSKFLSWLVWCQDLTYILWVTHFLQEINLCTTIYYNSNHLFCSEISVYFLYFNLAGIISLLIFRVKWEVRVLWFEVVKGKFTDSKADFLVTVCKLMGFCRSLSPTRKNKLRDELICVCEIFS